MQFYDFIYRDRLIHKLDPRAKILYVVMLTLAVFMTSNAYLTKKAKNRHKSE